MRSFEWEHARQSSLQMRGQSFGCGRVTGFQIPHSPIDGTERTRQPAMQLNNLKLALTVTPPLIGTPAHGLNMKRLAAKRHGAHLAPSSPTITVSYKHGLTLVRHILHTNPRESI